MVPICKVLSQSDSPNGRDAYEVPLLLQIWEFRRSVAICSISYVQSYNHEHSKLTWYQQLCYFTKNNLLTKNIVVLILFVLNHFPRFNGYCLIYEQSALIKCIRELY